MKVSPHLVTTRNHARKMAASETTTNHEAELWTQIADEIDAFLEEPEEPSLF